MAINATNILTFIKDLIGNEEKMGKFKEIVKDVKELISDIKNVIELIKK